MAFYGYTRVSTVEQAAGDRSSLVDQERQIRGIALLRGEEVAKIFVDPGISGAKPLITRPAGGELIETVQPGDVVVVAKMDRLFRSAKDALVTAENWQKAGVRLIIANMGPDPVTESGPSRMFFVMMAAMAEFERTLIRERCMEGRKARVAAGKSVGGLPPYGFSRVGKGRDASLVENPGEQKIINRARELAKAGGSVEVVRKRLEAEGFRSRSGKPLVFLQVQRILRAILPKNVLTPCP